MKMTKKQKVKQKAQRKLKIIQKRLSKCPLFHHKLPWKQLIAIVKTFIV